MRFLLAVLGLVLLATAAPATLAQDAAADDFAKLAASEPAQWRPAAAALAEAGPSALPGLLQRVDGTDRLLAIRAGSVIRRMGLPAVPALNAAGRTAFASAILRDRVATLLTGPAGQVALPDDAPALKPGDALDIVLARGAPEAVQGRDVLELLHCTGPADITGAGNVLRIRVFMNPPVFESGASLPSAAPVFAVFAYRGHMNAGGLHAQASAMQLMRAATIRVTDSGARTDAQQQPVPGVINDTTAPYNWFAPRMTIGGTLAYEAEWAGGQEPAQPDFLRAVRPLTVLAGWLPKSALAKVDLDDDDRRWFVGEVQRLADTRATQPLYAWVFSRAVVALGQAGDATALPLLRKLIASDATPAQTRWFATLSAAALLGDKAADVSRAPADAAAARTKVLGLLPE
ncbi:MAG: hypothetical protein AB7K09_15250 [Planctomycetota bacterium]